MVSLNNRFLINPDRNLSQKQKDGLNSAKAYCTGLMSWMALNSFGIPITNKIAKSALCDKDKNPQLNQTINSAVDKVLKSTGLSKKGVEIQNLNTKPFVIDGGFGTEQKIASIVKGSNASFNALNNKILVNRDKAPIFAFHEMGHAFNKNCSKFWKQVQSIRTISILMPALMLVVAAFGKKQEPKEGKKLTKFQKFKNFIVENSPAIAGIATLPMILEELRASLRANEWGKKVLNKDLLKKLNKTNAIAFTSYILVGLSAYGAVKLTKMAKDYLNNKDKESSFDKRPPRIGYHQG